MTLNPTQRNRLAIAGNCICFLLNAYGMYLSTRGRTNWPRVAMYGTIMFINAMAVLRARRFAYR